MRHDVVKATFRREDARGSFVEVTNRGPWQGVIHGRMNAGAVLGHHYHKKAALLFYLISGAVEIDFLHAESGARDSCRLGAGEGVRIEVLESHAVRFSAAGEFLMLKSVAYDPADPDLYELRVDAP